MCGIVGIAHSDPSRPVSPHAVRGLCDAIAHRGPDDEGIYTSGPVGLGMRRLSIIDLQGGHQPVFNEDRTVAIVFNGEIYNYRELRSWLQSRGHVLATHSDTETIVHLYEELGERCVERLRGMFAFAVWDTRQRRLLLARDRFGIKPLYFVEHPWGMAFASELKALHRCGLAGDALDWIALEGLFRVGYIPAPRTPFERVRKLEPGHTLSWKAGSQPKLTRYWDVPSGPSRSCAKPVDEVRERLDESVRAHMIADVPVAAFLSGGLDSSAVVSSMALAGNGAHAFTVRYRGSGAANSDETPLAESLARRYGVRLTTVDVEPDVQSVFERIIYSLDEPHADESSVPTWLLCERVAAEYKVALVGTGGDELFAGYRRHFGLAMASAWQRLPHALRRAASALGDRVPDSRGGELGITRLKRFLRSGGESLAARYLSLQDRLGPTPLFTRDIGDEIAAGYSRETFERHGAAGPTDGSVRPALYLDYKTYLPDDLLHLADRISMAHSLELRVPFVDHELIEAIFPLPDSVRVGLLRPKFLLRQALRDRLPEAHFRAPKRGFVGPTAEWLRHELAGVVADELASSRVERLGYFDARCVERLRREHANRRQNHEGILWALLCFSTWHRLFVENRPAASLPSSDAAYVIR
jgi:asparagine synthase (glutamine-hydrolysing)